MTVVKFEHYRFDGDGALVSGRSLPKLRPISTERVVMGHWRQAQAKRFTTRHLHFSAGILCRYDPPALLGELGPPDCLPQAQVLRINHLGIPGITLCMTWKWSTVKT